MRSTHSIIRISSVKRQTLADLAEALDLRTDLGDDDRKERAFGAAPQIQYHAFHGAPGKQREMKVNCNSREADRRLDSGRVRNSGDKTSTPLAIELILRI